MKGKKGSPPYPEAFFMMSGYLKNKDSLQLLRGLTYP
jgi:hypothetical protein